MQMFSDILQFQFFQNAVGAAVLTAIVCGLIGSYIVVRRIVFVSGGITHASFAGLGLGVYLGVNPIILAGVVAVLSALGIAQVGRVGQIREDSAIAGVWALGMALGVLFLTLTPGYTTGLSSYLFGNILLVTQQDLLFLGLFAVLMITVFARYYRTILYAMFDEDFARSRRLPVRTVNTMMLILVSIGLVAAIRLVGIMLLMSLLTLPQSIMSLFSSNLKHIILGSIGISLVANLLGLFVSYYWIAIPSGVSIVLILFLFMVITQLVHRFRGRSRERKPSV